MPFFGAAHAAAGETEKTLSFGYSAISERYLQRVTPAQVAMDALTGLSDIDPAVSVERNGNLVRLKADGWVVSQFAAPADGDVPGWSSLTLEVMEAGRGASEKLRQTDDDQMLKAAFETVLKKLDRFSRYSTPQEARGHRASRNGFAGVGIRYEGVGPDGVEIKEVIPESPAELGRLQAGDVLTHVDGKTVRNLTIEQVSELLRGNIGSRVTLTVLRQGKPTNIDIRRNLVVPPTVSMALEDGIANIRITGFNQRTASSLAKVIREARAALGADLKGVLLDLRGNPGGLLDQAVSMADLFMAQGRIVSTRGRHRHANQVYDASPGDLAEDLPLAVLVDGRSASASEILTAALQDSGRAVVIGTNSYGKGTVQTVIRLPNDGEMTLTWSRFHSPTGYALHGLGILPTICTSTGTREMAEMLNGIAPPPSTVAATLATWRSTDIEQEELRTQLRTACPSEKHEDHADESRLAERLLQDTTLYSRALAVSSPLYLEGHLTMPGHGMPSTAQAEVKAP